MNNIKEPTQTIDDHIATYLETYGLVAIIAISYIIVELT